MRDLGILNHRIPKHSKYMTEEARISSFEKWPKSDVKDPVELAKAGFYYTGKVEKRFSFTDLCQYSLVHTIGLLNRSGR